MKSKAPVRRCSFTTASPTAWTEGGDPNFRVLRGGSWYDEGRFCRSPHRNYYHYDTPTEDHGLRVVADLADSL